MQSKSIIIIIFLAVLTAFNAKAQQPSEAPADTSDLLKPEQIDVIKAYEPVLAKARRINVSPKLPEKAAQPEVGSQTYYSPPKSIDATFEPPELKALSAKKQSLSPVNNFWLKAGYGLRANPLVDISGSTGLSNNINAGAQIKYDAAKGSLENQEHQHIMGRAFARFVAKKFNVETALKYANQTHHYYGYNHLDVNFFKDEVLQNFSDFNITAKLANNRNLRGNFDFLLGGDVSFLSDKNSNNNTVVNLEGLGKKYFSKKYYVKAGAQLTLSTNSISNENTTGFLLNINPAVFVAPAGLEVGANIGLLNNKAYIYPKIKIEKYIVKDKIAFYGGWEKWPIVNTYRNFLYWNPFLMDDVKIENSIKEDRYIGFRGALTEQVTFNLKVKQQLVNNYAVFSSADSTFNRFQIEYDSLAKSIGIHPQVEIQVAKEISIKVSAEILAYDFSNVKAYHIPNYALQAGIILKTVKNLTVQGSINWADGRLVRFENPIVENAYTPIRDKVIIDLNASANYKISKNFDLFAEAKNILNQKYQLWNRYEAYGLQLRGGVIVKF